MGPKDRDYFMLRAGQELAAAARSRGVVRGRHEELAWLYQMRINYIDSGLLSDPETQAEPIRQIVLPA